MKWLTFSILILTLISCGSYSDYELGEFDKQIQEYIDSKGLDMTKTEDGMYYRILEEGTGEFIRFNDLVKFYYKGYFIDGNAFQSIEESDAIEFKVNQLIIGWQEALMMLKEGGSIHIIIPPQLAYGKQEAGIIPEDSILQYELTVLEVK